MKVFIIVVLLLVSLSIHAIELILDPYEDIAYDEINVYPAEDDEDSPCYY